MTTLIRVEFHCHTIYSKDSLTTPEKLLEVCRDRQIDRVAITDHNTTAGALAAKKLDPERVIVGEEIMTQEGELLAFYLKEEIPKDLPALEVIERLRDQGAFISVSHPFDVTRSGHWEISDLERIAPFVDAVEVFNSRCLLPSFNQKAADFAHSHSLLGTVGSDAHTRVEIGRSISILNSFTDTKTLRNSLSQAKYETRRSGLPVRLGSRYAVLMNKIGIVDF